MKYSLFVSCPKGLEDLLACELKALNLHVTEINTQGVYGEVEDLGIIYHICLWSRLANRVQLILFSGNAHNAQSLYQLSNQFPWQTVFTLDKTLAIEFHGTSKQIRNSMFGAQVIKDGIVDHFYKFKGQRPTIDRKQPQIRLHAHLKNDIVTVSFDLTGYSLHQRGYRRTQGSAPLKENLAAAILLHAQWPQLAAQGYSLQDPCCGAGTIVIEAAMMASHIAPGLLRQDQSLIYWAQHQDSLWHKIRTLALQQVKPSKIKLTGSDCNRKLMQIAQENAEHAGVAQLVQFTTADLNTCRPNHPRGLLITNPPYGERLNECKQLIPLYQNLGKILRTYYHGWHAAVLTSQPMLAKALNFSKSKQYTIFNGALECKLYCTAGLI